MDPVAPTITPWGTPGGESGNITMVSMQRHYDGANGARPKHSTLTRREYGLLAPEVLEGPEVDPEVTGSQGNRDNTEDAMGTGGTNRRETRTGERERQRAPLACGQPVE